MDTSLKDSLLGLKSKLQNIEKDFGEKIIDVESKESKNLKLDKEIDFLVATKNNIVHLNIGGKIFQTKIETLQTIKESIFANMIKEKIEKNENLNEEIFFDRSYIHFPIILNYLRSQKFTLKGMIKYDVEDLLCEARFYGLSEIVIMAEEVMKEIEFVSFQFAGQYSNGGTNRLEDINDRNLNTGFCINSPGWIVIELNYEHEIGSVEIGGYNGNTSLFAVSNGANAQLMTSTDKVTWTEVGKTPSNYGNQITTVKCTKKTMCKYFKVNHNSYLGIGFLKLHKE